MYDVLKTVETNKNCCNLKCEYCKIFVHSYTCTCADNVVRLNICKHIHAVVSRNEEETSVGCNGAASDEISKKEEIDTTIKSLFILKTTEDKEKKTSVNNKINALLEMYNRTSCKPSSANNEKLQKYLNLCLSICNESQEDHTTEVRKTKKERLRFKTPCFQPRRKRRKHLCRILPTRNLAQSGKVF